MIFNTGQLPGEWYPAVSNLQLSHSGEMLVFIQYLWTRQVMSSFTSSLWVMNNDGSNPRELVGHYKPDLHSC